ncbi:MAG: cytidylate kinase family protein [Candidatus Nanohaloarchaea archaeon]
MESFIQEFEGQREKNSDTVISVCGPSGAGKGTLTSFIAEQLGLSSYSAGDFFREIAEKKDISVEELSGRADKSIDRRVDERTLDKALNEDCVIDSRISAWVLGSYADFTIYVTADLEERARRVKKDIEGRKAETAGTVEDIKENISERDKDNRERYRKYYGIDMSNSTIFDLVVDNTEMSIKEQEKLVKKALKKHFPEKIR